MSANKDAGTGPRKRGFWHDLSIPQIIAGALAAVTSMLLSNKIGIAGSVIGVAVGSVVTAVSGAAYKSIIARSASAMKQAVPFPFEKQPDAQEAEKDMPPADATTVQPAAQTTVLPADADKTTLLDASMKTQDLSGGSSARTAEETRAMPVVAQSDETAAVTPEEDRLITRELGFDPYGEANVAPQDLLARARRRRKHEQIKLLVVTLASALLAVAASAAVVLLLTQGEGLGEKRSVIYVPATTTQETSDPTGSNSGTDAKPSSTDASSTTSGADSAAKDETAKDTANTETSSGANTGSATTPGTGTDSSIGADANTSTNTDASTNTETSNTESSGESTDKSTTNSEVATDTGTNQTTTTN